MWILVSPPWWLPSMSIRTTKMKPQKGSAIIPPGTANGKRKFMSRQRIFQKGGGGCPGRPLICPGWLWQSWEPGLLDAWGRLSKATGDLPAPCSPSEMGLRGDRVGFLPWAWGPSAGEQLHHDVHHLYPKCTISSPFLTQVANHSRISSTCDFVSKGNHQYFHISQLLQRAQNINSHGCFKTKVTRPAAVATHSGKQAHSEGQCR